MILSDPLDAIWVGTLNTIRVYGPCSRAWTRLSNTDVILDSRVRGPCSRAPVHTTRVHGPVTRPVNTDSVYRAPVNTGRVDDPW